MSGNARWSIVEARHVTPTPWRNGAGLTRELLTWPSPVDWRIRISLATIAADGPFSEYPGVTRDFCVLDGGGVLLDFGEGVHAMMKPGDPPLRFDGSLAPQAWLTHGPTRDFNLMVRGVDAVLDVADPARREAVIRPWGLFAIDAARMSIDGIRFDMPAETLVWFDDGVDSATFEGRGWWIRRTPRAPASAPVPFV